MFDGSGRVHAIYASFLTGEYLASFPAFLLRLSHPPNIVKASGCASPMALLCSWPLGGYLVLAGKHQKQTDCDEESAAPAIHESQTDLHCGGRLHCLGGYRLFDMRNGS